MRYLSIIAFVLASLFIAACAAPQDNSPLEAEDIDAGETVQEGPNEISGELDIGSIDNAEEEISAEEDIQDASAVIDDW